MKRIRSIEGHGGWLRAMLLTTIIGVLPVLTPTATLAAGSDATALLADGTGASVGTVSLTQEGGKVRIAIEAVGLTPGFHGMHVHAIGTCTGPGFTSAGGHHNPGTAGHGSHAGDLPALYVTPDGKATVNVTSDRFSVASLMDADGSAIIVHAGADNFANIPTRYVSSEPGAPAAGGADNTTLGTGDAGGRSACGVVQSKSSFPTGQGYWEAASDGGIFNFGNAGFYGSMGGKPLASPILDLVPTLTGRGYWEVASDGGIFAFGDATFRGSMGGKPLNKPVVGMAARQVDAVATLVNGSGAAIGTMSLTQDGTKVRVRVDASGLTPGFHGMHVHGIGTCTGPGFTSAGGHHNPGAASHGAHAGDLPLLYVTPDGNGTATFSTERFSIASLMDADGSAIIVHAGADNYANIPTRYVSSEPGAPAAGGADNTTLSTGDAGARAACGALTSLTGNGYWEVASDGGIFAFGDAGFYGSMGGKPLAKPIVDMAATRSGRGYWEVASDGGIFAFGDAGFYGSMGGKPLAKPIVDMAATRSGRGYWEVASDGGIFAFGDAGFYGSMGGKPLASPIVDIIPTASGNGYWEVASDGGIFAFGDAGFYGSMGGKPLALPVIAGASIPS